MHFYFRFYHYPRALRPRGRTPALQSFLPFLFQREKSFACWWNRNLGRDPPTVTLQEGPTQKLPRFAASNLCDI